MKFLKIFLISSSKYILIFTGSNLLIFLHLTLGVLSALKNLQDRLKQVEHEKKDAEQHLSKLTPNAASSTHSAGNISFSVSSSLLVVWLVSL